MTKEEAICHVQEILDDAWQEWGEAHATGAGMATKPKVESPKATRRKQVPKVVNDDLVEHELTGGTWEGIGAVRKGGKIWIGVSACIKFGWHRD